MRNPKTPDTEAAIVLFIPVLFPLLHAKMYFVEKADPDPDASYLSSGTPLPRSFNEHLSAHVALTRQKQPLSKFTCPETLPDCNDSLTCQSRKKSRWNL